MKLSIKRKFEIWMSRRWVIAALGLLCCLKVEAQLMPPPLQNGPGSTSGPAIVNSRNGVANVLDYGAICNSNGSGTGTDDSAAIAAAITAAGKGGTVIFPSRPGGSTAPKACLVSQTLHPLSFQTWRASDRGGTAGDTTATLDFTNLADSIAAVDASNTVNVQFISIGIVNNTGTNFHGQGFFATNAQYLRFENCKADGLFGQAYNIQGSTFIYFYDSQAQNNVTGFDIYNDQYVSFIGGFASNCQASGWNVKIEGTGAGSEQITITGMVIDEASGVGLEIDDAKDVTVEGTLHYTVTGHDTIKIGDGVYGDTNRVQLNNVRIMRFNGVNGFTPSTNVNVNTNALNVVLNNVTTEPYGTVGDVVDNGINTVFLNVNGKSSGTGLIKASALSTTTLSTPVNAAFTSQQLAGCSLVHSTTYFYRVAAVDSSGQTTLASTETSTTTSTGADTYCVNVNWTQVYGAAQYKIYGRATGAEQLLFTVGGSQSQWTDNGSLSPSGALPAANLTGQLTLGNHITCTMGAGTSCTATVPSGSSCICQSTSATSSASSINCSVSGTTATCNASAANSNVWNVIPF